MRYLYLIDFTDGTASRVALRMQDAFDSLSGFHSEVDGERRTWNVYRWRKDTRSESATPDAVVTRWTWDEVRDENNYNNLPEALRALVLR